MSFKQTATTFTHMSQSFAIRHTPWKPRNKSRSGAYGSFVAERVEQDRAE